jgi:hypothetical protein
VSARVGYADVSGHAPSPPSGCAAARARARRRQPA